MQLKRQQAEAMLRQRQQLPDPQFVAGTQAMGANGGPTQAAARATRQVDPRAALMIQLARQGLLPIDKALEAYDPNYGREEVKQYLEQAGGATGVQQVGRTRFGDPVGGAVPKPVPAEFVNTGGAQTAVNKFTTAPGTSLPMTMTPEGRDASARGWAGVGLQRERLNFDKGGGTEGIADPTQAALIKKFGKPEAGRRWKADGSLEPIPGGSADTKAQVANIGKGTVSDVVASLRTMYDQLDESGGVTNPEKGVIDNVVAGVASSGVGQAAGRVLGTQNQSLRNTIIQQRPLLVQSIMKATGMSAKQLDSNAELKLYLSVATDPTLDVAANRRALDMIETLYGAGAPKEGGASGSWDASNASGQWSIKPKGK